MTDHTVRLYAAVTGLVVFFGFWAAVAAKPWAASDQIDPRATAIERREQRLARETRRVNRVVHHRFASYEKRLGRRRQAIARRKRENRAALAAARRVAAAPPPSSGWVSAPPSAPAPPAQSWSGPAPAAPPAPPVSVTPAPPVTKTSSS
jgi:hypothetical protein